MTYQLVKPSAAFLPSYLEALHEGDFSPMQLGFGKATPAEIEADPAAWLARINNPAPFTVTLKNGVQHQITGHELLWIVDGERFLGTVALRYAGDQELIEIYAGHIGVAVRPALLNRGIAPRALKTLLQDLAERAKMRGISTVYMTCHPDNRASSRLIEHFGGVLQERLEDVFDQGPILRYKIALG